MKKRHAKKLTLATETLRILSDRRVQGAAGFATQVTDECDTQDNTCYWGCSFASCPAGGCGA